MFVVGSQTLRYPPGFLAFPYLWAAVSVVAGALCVVCSVRPTRWRVASSGAFLVTATFSRSLAIAGEVVAGHFPNPENQAAFVVGGTVWALVSVMILVLWREYVVPWSIGFHL